MAARVTVQFNPQEQQALQGLPLIARVLYFELRCRMDMATGMVGLVRGAGISWQGVTEWLYVEPHRGMQETGSPHKSAVRRAAEWLAKAGLLEDRSIGMRLQFFLPLATADYSAQKKADTKPTQSRHSQPDTKADRSEPNNGAAFVEKADTQPDTKPTDPKTPQADIPPESGYISHTSVEVDTDQRAREKRGPMRAEWEPDADALRAHLHLLGVSRETTSRRFVREQLGDFRSYWSERDLCLTTAQWTQKFAKRLKVVTAGLAGGNNAKSRTTRAKRDFIAEDIEACRRSTAGGPDAGDVPGGAPAE